MLDVLLNGLHVGVLVREDPTNIVSFILDDAYLSKVDRWVLGQQFEERRSVAVFRQAGFPGQLPTFFANLLPEGALQAMVNAQFAPVDAMATLAIVGEDLPGAVVIRPAPGQMSVPVRARTFDEPSISGDQSGDGLRFSLAGVQLKFSAVESADQRFTLPFRGLGGRWILKFGSEAFPGLPENEGAMMDWAAAAGLDVPAHRLVPASSIEALDPRFIALGEQAFAIQRYDRRGDDTRVHQEDFAQVRGVPPDRKYQRASLEGLARFVGDLCGSEDLAEFLRRVLFLVLCGNTDAHLKNWSLIYPDGRRARLAPAYDFVCVRQYWPENQLALPFAKERMVERIGWEHVARVEKFLRQHGHVTDFEKNGREFVRRSLDAWSSQKASAHPTVRTAIDTYLPRLPLVRDLPR